MEQAIFMVAIEKQDDSIITKFIKSSKINKTISYNSNLNTLFNTPCVERYDWTMLMIISEFSNYLENYEKYITLLVSYGANLDAKNCYGQLELFRKNRRNDENVMSDSWDDLPDPIIGSNNYWYSREEMKNMQRCPYTQTSFDSIHVLYDSYSKKQNLQQIKNKNNSEYIRYYGKIRYTFRSCTRS